MNEIHTYEKTITKYLFEQLNQIENIEIIGPSPELDPERASLATFYVKNIHSTLVFFEAPNRLEKTLEELFLFLGNRPVSICREISKKFEEIIMGNIKDLLRNFDFRKLKGEVVIILRGAEHSTNDTGNLEDLILLSEGNFSTSEKAKKISKITGLSKKDVYDRIIKLDNLKQKI